jgi:hypothetical protein
MQKARAKGMSTLVHRVSYPHHVQGQIGLHRCLLTGACRTTAKCTQLLSICSIKQVALHMIHKADQGSARTVAAELVIGRV